MRASALLTGALLLLGTVACGSSLTGAQGGCSSGSGSVSAAPDGSGVTAPPSTSTESGDETQGCEASGRLDGPGEVVLRVGAGEEGEER